ncbi:MAG: electron transport complex subunit RsxC [Gammaproteobacteria bacterium]|nr:electron transport complex subunit RsxC [Gammaproteobacteria bacterium]
MKRRRLWKFHGGVHLPQQKTISTTMPVHAAQLPKRLVLPLHQHIGASAKAVVEVGDNVLKGELIAHASGYVSAPIHAPSSGTVVAIADHPIPHPSGLHAPCIVIETDGEERWVEARPYDDYLHMDPSHLRNLVREAGIVGLGGAGFPSYIKLNPGADKVIDTLILNGAECEPFITCDDMLMREQPEQIVEGLHILQHALRAKRCIIALEDNKPEAYTALSAAVAKSERCNIIEIVQIPTIFPAGGEKQLIKVLTGKEVPHDGLPLHIGLVIQNVATCAAIHRAINLGQPLISRYVTITGGGVSQPRNLEVLIGTPIQELLEQCGALDIEPQRLIMGGPMMGIAVHTSSAPIIKTSNCVIAATDDDLPSPQPVMPCIRCGACADACPALLLPQQLYWYARAKNLERIQEINLFDCIECGCCSHVCPSHIPLVQYFRFAKTEIWSQEREKERADLARQRHDSRLERIEREKAERAARLQKKKQALKERSAGDSSKKAAIAAAVKRAQEKKARQQTKEPSANEEDSSQ